MSTKVTKVLHITEMLSAAGIESFIMNMYKHIDRNKIQFDFLVLRNQEEYYDEEIKKLGGNKYFVHSNLKNTWLRILDESIQIKRFLDTHPYDIVHIHYTTPLRAPYLLAAKRAGIKTRIYHAHSAMVLGKSKLKLKVYNYYQKKITAWGTDWFACSQAAAEWIFNKELIESNLVRIIYNGIDTNRFKYDKNKRENLRLELGLGDDYVLINTGRFIDQKNQEFVLDVFNEIKKTDSTSKLLFLGDGVLLDKIKMKTQLMGLQNDVLFLGVKSNVEDYLSAADCYIMPSLYEGLPVAAVEAECSGLPCILSTNITNEVALTNTTQFISLDTTPAIWGKEILKYKNTPRVDNSTVITQRGYNVQTIANWLQKFYICKAHNKS